MNVTPCDDKWNKSINKNTITIFLYSQENQKRDITTALLLLLLMCICLKMMKSLWCAFFFFFALTFSHVHACAAIHCRSPDAHMHRPLSSNSPLLLAIIPFHTLSIPKTVVHRNQQQTLAFLPIISPPLFFITQRTLPPSPLLSLPLSCSLSLSPTPLS